MTIPTYVVNFTIEGIATSLRVPERALEAFLSVLVFNGVEDFSAKREAVR